MNTIHALLADVMTNIDKIAKTGENKGLGYTYASESDLLETVQPLLAERGIMLRKESSEIIVNEYDDRGKHKFLIKVVWSFEIAHEPKDEKRIDIEFLRRYAYKTESYGYAECKQGFAPAKAQTQTLKYALRQTFCIPTGDEPDATAAPELEDAKKLILHVGYGQSKEIKKLGAKTEWDRSGPGKDTFLHWWIEDTPENRKKFKKYIKQEENMIEKMRKWADERYNGFEEMKSFCIEKTNKGDPTKWSPDTISDFIVQMDGGNGIKTAYDSWYRKRYAEQECATHNDNMPF